MTRDLRPHQLKAFRYLEEHNESGALFMQMRLGKTLVVIRSLMQRFGKRARVLVICPVEGLYAWRTELAMEGLTAVVLAGTAEERIGKIRGNNPGWYAINYEGLPSCITHLSLQKWDAIVIDESRRMANPKTITSKNILRKLPLDETASRIVMCGEPAPESPLEYFNQLCFVFGSFMKCRNYWQFRNIYCRELMPGEWIFKKGVMERFKDELHRLAFFMNEKDAGLKMKKVYQVRTHRPSAEMKQWEKQILRDFSFTKQVGQWALQTSTKWVPVQHIWLRQLASGFLGDKMVWAGRVNALMELLKGELKNEQVVVWFNFNNAVGEVRNRLRQENIKCSLLFGDTDRTSREAEIDRFRSGASRVLLAQIKCGRTSINLSNAGTAIYFTGTPSLDDRVQTEARILSPFKTGPSLILDFITEGSVEEDVHQQVRFKRSDANFYKKQFVERLKSMQKERK